MFGAQPCDLDEIRSVKPKPRYGEGSCDARRAVGVVGHPALAVTVVHLPAQSVRRFTTPPHQRVGTDGRKPLGLFAAMPKQREHDARVAQKEIVHRSWRLAKR